MSFNPLDMRGPQFLFFYFCFGCLVVFLVRFVIRTKEFPWTVPKLDLTDPYQIAFLRGGEKEAIRVATISLLDRGLLQANESTLQTLNTSSLAQARRPIEQAILNWYLTPADSAEVFSILEARQACVAYDESLTKLLLLADTRAMATRKIFIIAGLGALLGVAAAKICVALARGHSNVGFLILLAIGFSSLLTHFYQKRRTSLGDRALADLKTLFDSLINRSLSLRPGGQTNEATLLAAIFGGENLSPTNFPFVKILYPQPKPSNSSCGSGTSSSCGSSCGGGCGGGCGGCGS